MSTNWAGTYEYMANRLHRPTSIDQIAEIVEKSGAVHVLGSRHSFNDIADTTGDLVCLADLPSNIEIDDDSLSVSVCGGVTYGQLGPLLIEAGWALHNLASLPHISIAGAVATGTHGSGNANGSLATAVAGLEILTGDGEVVELNRRTGAFRGSVVNLGALGVVTRLTLDIEPTFTVRQYVFDHLPFDDLINDFDGISETAYSVSVFTNWVGDSAGRVVVKSTSEQVPTMFGATAATIEIAGSWTPQLGVPGPWSDRLAHFKLESTPSVGAELQSEYLIGREHAAAAIEVLRGLGPQISPVLFVSEIRTVAATDLWLDPAYGRDSVAFGFTCRPDQSALEKVLPLIEEGLAEFAPRPHWGKVFTLHAGALAARYDKLADFRGLAEYFDPRGVFRNAYLRRNVWGE
jgi:xylitol oxidase